MKHLLLRIACAAFAGAPAVAQVFTEFSVPTASSHPRDITTGPDGNLWFTEQGFLGSRIGRITPSGTITEFPTPTAHSAPTGITVGPDGNLWFTEVAGGQIGRITPSGTITEFSIPTANSGPTGIASGPDGNLWFTEFDKNRIARMTTGGAVTEFVLPGSTSGPNGITVGPDGNLWFAEWYANQIGRITTAGVITEFAVPTIQSDPSNIAAGPDGNLWFTEFDQARVGRITTSGVITEFVVPTSHPELLGIASGPDGNLWFAESGPGKIGYITPAGAITEFLVPTPDATTVGVTSGPDGCVWFTEESANKIGRITPSPCGPPPLASYTFDNNSDIEFDSSGNGHEGVLGVATIVSGLCGNALRFNPDNVPPLDEFTVPSASDLNLVGGMTGMAFIRPLGQQSTDNNPGCTEGTIFSKGGNYWFQVEKNNDQLVFQNEGSGTDLARVNIGLCIGRWTHVAFVRAGDGKTIRFFRNGKPIGSPITLANVASASTSPVMVGNYGFGDNPGACEFNGDIDQIRIYNRALSNAEVQAAYGCECHDLPCLVWPWWRWFVRASFPGTPLPF